MEARGGSHMSRIKTVWQLSLYLVALAFATTALSADAPKPSGKVSITSTSIAAGIGVSWGDGTLNFNGKDHKFSIQGLTLVDFGISKADAVGDVYNLTDVSKFEGNYVAGEAGFALAGGMGGMSLRNQNGVIMHLRSVSQGAKLQLGPAGMNIKIK
jgi:hypothetical protein